MEVHAEASGRAAAGADGGEVEQRDGRAETEAGRGEGEEEAAAAEEAGVLEGAGRPPPLPCGADEHAPRRGGRAGGKQPNRRSGTDE